MSDVARTASTANALLRCNEAETSDVDEIAPTTCFNRLTVAVIFDVV